MSTLTYFSVVGAYYASLVDSYDVDTDPDLVPLFGRVRFTPQVDAGDVVKAQTLTPPTNLLLKPIEAEVKAGKVWSNGTEGVKLVANTAVLELDGALYYQVDFPDGLTARGTQYQVDSFPFLAPTTAATIDLSEVTPMPGQPATGPVPTSTVLTVNGRTGYIVLSADDVDAYTVAETDAAITAAVNALIAGAPGALDTLNELAAALGDDANFAASVTTALAGKQPLDTELTAIGSVTSAANKVPYFTGSGTAAVADFTATGRSLAGAADTAAARGIVAGGLIAPPPTGNRTTDSANLQALVDTAQATNGTVILREGTYAADIVTSKTAILPRIVGQGRRYTLIDGTIKLVGLPGSFSGGWLSDFGFTGSHASAAALEIAGADDVHWARLDVAGTYARGLLLHNEAAGDYTELCCGEINIGSTVTTAVEYRVTAGAPSFHGSGLTAGSTLNQAASPTAPLILIGAGARPYNAPMSATIWTRSNAQPIIKSLGSGACNFYGNLNIEAFNNAAGGAIVCEGQVQYTGTVNAFGASTFASNPAAVSLGSLLLGDWVATRGNAALTESGHVIRKIYDSNGNQILDLNAIASATSYLQISNASDDQPKITAAGTATDINILVQPKNAGKVTIRNGADTTKRAHLDTASISTATSRVFTFPDATGTFALAPLVQEFIASTGSPVSLSGQAIPAAAVGVRLTMIPPGSGGGSGRRGAAGTVRCGGGAAAGGAVYRDLFIPLPAGATTWGLSMPEPGPGGAAVTADSTDGNPGTGPVDSVFTLGTFTFNGRSQQQGSGGTATTGAAGGAFSAMIQSAGGGSASTTGGVGASGGGAAGVGGAGAGGGITSGNVANNGGAGGRCYTVSSASIAAGVVDGSSPGGGPAAVAGLPGAGPGGGAASITQAAQAGANGVGYGSPGGGGGASLNGFNSGKGGDGGPGFCRLEWVIG